MVYEFYENHIIVTLGLRQSLFLRIFDIKLFLRFILFNEWESYL